jgi:predicted metal-dependent phosphoesterase TrpH
MLAELHMHSNYSRGTKVVSEGWNKPEQMVARARQLGLNAVALTDHNTIGGHKKAKQAAKKHGLVFIPGEEVECDAGHILALGINEWIRPKLSLSETIDLIHDQGGIAVAAHPFDAAGKGLGVFSKKCDAIEVFDALNIERVANWKGWNFAKKHKMVMTAGSDAHYVEMMGYGITRLNANDMDGAIKAIKKGKVSIARNEYIPTKIIVDWSVLRLKKSYENIIDYMDGNYRWPKRFVGKKLLRLVDSSPGSIDYLFKLMGYTALGGIIIYTGTREIIGV